MYLNLQLGNFHVVLGKLAEQAVRISTTPEDNQRMLRSLLSLSRTATAAREEFFLDDESKLRYQTHQQSI